MSGGHFDYQQYQIHEIARQLKESINKYEDAHSPETVAEFRKGYEVIQAAYVYAQRIDWLLSGDDSEDTFHKRLEEELADINYKPVSRSFTAAHARRLLSEAKERRFENLLHAVKKAIVDTELGSILFMPKFLMHNKLDIKWCAERFESLGFKTKMTEKESTLLVIWDEERTAHKEEA